MFENIILIPYRNRKEHFDYFIKNSWPLIKDNLLNTKLVVIEQEEGKLFNRGKILNVGFKEFLDKTNYFITHDVDINPKTNAVKTYYSNVEYDVIRIYCSHNASLGGICKLSRESVYKTNGLPNYIWGWGIEDRALFYRCCIADCSISPLYNKYDDFIRLSHSSNAETYKGEKKIISDKENYIFHKASKEEQLNHIMNSGLNNLDYEILERKDIEDNVEWIKVAI
jgi:hypothetical protein